MAMGSTNSAGVAGYNALSAMETANEIKKVLVGDSSDEGGTPSIAKSLESMADSLKTMAENATIRFAKDENIRNMLDSVFGDRGKEEEAE